VYQEVWLQDEFSGVDAAEHSICMAVSGVLFYGDGEELPAVSAGTK
jgi:hypothetical protein